jgi:hypothetical protein
MQHLQEPTVAPGSTPSDAAEPRSKPRVRRKALTGPITLEAHFSPATASRSEVIGDALRLLAVWAVRVAQATESAAPEPGDSP